MPNLDVTVSVDTKGLVQLSFQGKNVPLSSKKRGTISLSTTDQRRFAWYVLGIGLAYEISFEEPEGYEVKLVNSYRKKHPIKGSVPGNVEDTFGRCFLQLVKAES